MSSSIGKRERERQKLEKAKAKAERKAARREADADVGGEIDDPSSLRSESELMEDLGALHRALEAGQLSPEEFEERRTLLHAEFERLSS
jgi:hypothetical protein